jgi:hypothetical protein
MAMPSVTIGMAHHKDFNGAVFSVQSSRIQGDPVERYVVIDNSAHVDPETHRNLANLLRLAGGTVVPSPQLDGTSSTRNEIFRHTKSDIVIVIDCHVLLRKGAVEAVQRYFSVPENRKNILSGPRWDDTLIDRWATTQFNPQWNEGMWGRWGTVWLDREGNKFTVMEDIGAGTCLFRGMAGSIDLPSPPKGLPVGLAFPGHEKALYDLGCRTWVDASGPGSTVETPGHGLGCFAVWRENWLGFPEAATGFGAEELCVHEFYRNNGGQSVCLWDLMWWHRFWRGFNGAPYQAPNWKKIRNYVLGYVRAGLDLSPVYEHFVQTSHKLMTQHEWDRLVADPVSYTPEPAAARPVVVDKGLPQPRGSDAESLGSIRQWLHKQPRDFNDHIPFLASFAERCGRVAEFSGRRDSMVALTACPGSIWSYNDESHDPLGQLIADIQVRSTTTSKIQTLHRFPHGVQASLTVTLPEPVDLLFLDTLHTGERITAELDRHASKSLRWIVIHDTELFRTEGDGGSGMGDAIDNWVAANPEWFVMMHIMHQHGLTILSRNKEDHPGRVVRINTGGAGTELEAIIKALDVTLQKNCTCKATLRQMDMGGTQWCRDNINDIIAKVEANKAVWKIEAALQTSMPTLSMLTKGLTTWEGWKIGAGMFLSASTDPVPVMVKLAISRAEAKGF